MGVQRLFHQILGAVAVILVVSGAMMHSESLRGLLADFRFALRGLHRLGGVLFILLFFCQCAVFFDFSAGKARRGESARVCMVVGCCGNMLGYVWRGVIGVVDAGLDRSL